MIPVRVPVDAAIHVASRGRLLSADHPLFDADCPVCDGCLGFGGPVALVLVGIAPEDRKPVGWTTGAPVAVHEECVGPS